MTNIFLPAFYFIDYFWRHFQRDRKNNLTPDKIYLTKNQGYGAEWRLLVYNYKDTAFSVPMYFKIGSKKFDIEGTWCTKVVGDGKVLGFLSSKRPEIALTGVKWDYYGQENDWPCI